MAEEGSAPARGGYRQLGERSDSTQKTIDNLKSAIMKTWNLTSFEEMFPAAIKPTKELGSSLITHLRTISKRATLAAAQAMFLQECKDASGAPVPLSFGHASKIAKELLAAEAASKPAKGGSKDIVEETPTTATMSKSRSRTTEPVKKSVGTPNVPDSLITPGKSIAPPFTFGSSPLSKSVEDKQKAKPHTKGVAIPKRTPANGTSSSRLSTYGSAFSFLNDDVSPSSAMKKRPLPAKIGEKNEKQERGPTVKKIRTEDSLASKLAKTLSHPESGENELVHKAVKNLDQLFEDGSDPDVEMNTTLHKLSDDEGDQMAELNKIMLERKMANEKLFGKTFPDSTAFVGFDGKDNKTVFESNTQEHTQAVTLKDKKAMFSSMISKFAPRGVSKETLASLSPGVLKQNLPGLEGDTIIVAAPTNQTQTTATRASPSNTTFKKATVDDNKPTNSRTQDVNIQNGLGIEEAQQNDAVALVAPMMSSQARPADMPTIEQTEPGSAVEDASILPSTALQAMALQASDSRPDPLKQHCGFIATGFSEVLDTQQLTNLARPDQQAMVNDLKMVFDAAMRHLEVDITYVFKKHGSEF